MTDRLSGSKLPKMWDRISKKYLNVNNITGIDQESIARQIEREMRQKNDSRSKQGDFERLIDAGFPKKVAEDPSIRRQFVQENVRFIEYKRRGKTEYAAVQKRGDPIDHKHRPPIFLARTTENAAKKSGRTPTEILQERVRQKGFEYDLPASPQLVERKPARTRYPKRR